ncbi:hypothetical protein LTR99_005665 [Exophiala xenobiotica]|uniref:Uncharacterized protein n=1 Tax=Vermiconidia calcicola TaxID=1690605 RepID=A0AAV9QFF8_9PEZI|nr:hypothetical protein LTR96_004782 [Exophiala xenobiotica]KAK5540291.1 hypothetical protein LTR23_006388 [Chaetothyriales sp. CCFEE 6169]KAK5541261.1 hypothetical protein LTR25_003038 [Vermiconidia calcicola]KAK5302708.1 hypothetical protein LTR99_005665 [Exophiala xenobiotica]KAK5340403.1 hypothetical protein LTR98_003525 [Exophiala xenobiotica]
MNHLPNPPTNPARMIRLRIGTGLDALDFDQFPDDSRQFGRNFIQRVNGLVPDRYLPSGAHSSAIGRAIARAVPYVNDTCPLALRRANLPPNCDFRERCRVIASLIPITYFPTSGEVKNRFFEGLIRYLLEVRAKVDSFNPPSLPAPAHRRVPGTSGPTSSSSSNPGSNETSAIKIESDNEGNPIGTSSKKRKTTKNTMRHVANSSSETPKKRKRKSEVLGDPEPPHERRAALLAEPSPLGLQNAHNPVVQVTERRPDVKGITEQLRIGLEVSPATRTSPESSGHETTDEDSETESETSSEDASDYGDVRPSIESTSEVAAPRPPKSKKKPLNVYRAMYEEASEEIRFLQDLLMKGAGLTEADLKAAKIRVNNKMSYKYAFESVYNRDHQEERPAKTHKPAKKKARVTI